MRVQVEALAQEAGSMLLNAKRPEVTQKEGHANFVTETDVAVQQFLMEGLAGLLPGAHFFAEEQDNEVMGDGPTWVIDPIDGTLNFMRGRHCSCISIALLKEKRPVLAVIYDPYLDMMYGAEMGRGAFCNGERIHVATQPIERAVVAFGTSPYDAELTEKSMRSALAFLLKAADVRRCGSAALDLCDVAAGRSDVFFEWRLSPWDFAAGALLVTEAGGMVGTMGNMPIRFDAPSPVLAASVKCHAAACKILSMFDLE